MTTVVDTRKGVGVKSVEVIAGIVAGSVAFLVAALAYYLTFRLSAGTMAVGSAAIMLALVGFGLLLFVLAKRFPVSGVCAAGVILVLALVVLLQPNAPVPLLDVSELSLPSLIRLGARSYLAPLLSVALLAGAYSRGRKM